jgi:hypothetical protein
MQNIDTVYIIFRESYMGYPAAIHSIWLSREDADKEFEKIKTSAYSDADYNCYYRDIIPIGEPKEWWNV